jgi:arsenate reductase
MALTIYGIPNCGTVKKAKAWLDARDIAYDWVDFRATPVSADRVAGWVEAMGSRAMRNTSGVSCRALAPDKKAWSDARWATAFSEDSLLINRPHIERDGRAVLTGFRGIKELLSGLLAE